MFDKSSGNQLLSKAYTLVLFLYGLLERDKCSCIMNKMFLSMILYRGITRMDEKVFINKGESVVNNSSESALKCYCG